MFHRQECLEWIHSVISGHFQSWSIFMKVGTVAVNSQYITTKMYIWIWVEFYNSRVRNKDYDVILRVCKVFVTSLVFCVFYFINIKGYGNLGRKLSFLTLHLSRRMSLWRHFSIDVTIFANVRELKIPFKSACSQSVAVFILSTGRICSNLTCILINTSPVVLRKIVIKSWHI